MYYFSQLMFSTFYIWGHVVSVGISSFSFVVLLEISHEAIAHLENFSLLFLMLFQSYFNLFSFVFVGFNSCFFIIHLRLWDSHFLEKILVLFLWFFWKSLKQTWIDCVPSTLWPFAFFNFPMSSICWIAFGSAFNLFCLFKSTAIHLL